jgi:polar amino acid transport system substrate-binding protein
MIKLLHAGTGALLLQLVLGGFASADTLDQIQERGSIRWGADQEGGGPYVYPSPDDPGRVIGFEVDLMALLAAQLGVQSEFKQCEWTALPSLLQRGDIDVITNGYELRPEHVATKLATIPYYVYELQLIARRDDSTIQSWDDLARGPRKKTVGVYTGSAAEAYVAGRLGDRVKIRTYDGFTQAMRDLESGSLDATVQDLPPAIFYQNRYPKVHFVDSPVGKGYYVIYLRKGDERLRDELNAALLDVIRSGQLRAIYEHYGIWNGAQDTLGTPSLGRDATEVSVEVHGWEVFKRNLPILLQSAGMTVLLTCLSMPLAILAGLLVALGRLYGPLPLRWLLTSYVEILRGTPVLMQLYTIYYVIPPAFGFYLPPVPAAILGLAMNYSAYESEIYRAGLLAIPIGQMEAALSLGMSKAVALRRIIIPQAVRLVIPPVTNDFIALFKDTSICSVITVVELMKRYQILVNTTNAYLELFSVTALLYLMMSYPLSLLARRLERRLPKIVM